MLRIKSFLLILLFAVCISSSPVSADTSSLALDELVGLLSRMNSFQASFTQQSFDKGGKPIQVLTGQLLLKKPDRFFWKSDEPYAQQLVSNGKSIWHYDPDLEQVVVQQFGEQVMRTPIMVVLKDPAMLARDFRLEKKEARDEKVEYRLAAVNDKEVIRSIRIGFREGKLASLGFSDNLDQRTEVLFSKVVHNLPLEESRFEFLIPAGADVVHE